MFLDMEEHVSIMSILILQTVVCKGIMTFGKFLI